MNDLKNLVIRINQEVIDNPQRDIKITTGYNIQQILNLISGRFIMLYFNVEEENITIKENKLYKKEIEQIENKKTKLSVFDFLNNFILTFFVLIIFTCIFGIISGQNIFYDYIYLITPLTLSATLSKFIISHLKNKKQEKQDTLSMNYHGKIEKKFLNNFNKKTLKIILSIITELENIRNQENTNVIDSIKTLLIEESYLLQNNKHSPLIFVRSIIIEQIANTTNEDKEKLNNKMILENQIVEDISIEQKLDFLNRKLIES